MVGSSGENMTVAVFLLLNMGDYSRRCERRFVSEDGTVQLLEPLTRDKSVADFRNIGVVLVENVRQLIFERLTEDLLSDRSISFPSLVSRRKYVNLSIDRRHCV